MNWQLMFKGDYISAVEFAGKKPLLTISDAKLCLMADEKTGADKDKGVVFFKEITRGWVLCKTNAICLAAMFGDDTVSWVGKRVWLHAVDVKFGKKMVPGIRVIGSPDLPAAIKVEVKLPRKKPIFMTMHGARANAPAPAAPVNGKPAAAPPPAPAAPPPAAAPTHTPDELAAGVPPDDLPLPTGDGRKATAHGIVDELSAFDSSEVAP